MSCRRKLQAVKKLVGPEKIILRTSIFRVEVTKEDTGWVDLLVGDELREVGLTSKVFKRLNEEIGSR